MVFSKFVKSGILILYLTTFFVDAQDSYSYFNNLRMGQQETTNLLTNSNNQCTFQSCGSYQCNRSAFCLNNASCLCAPGYITVPPTNDYQCCYEQRKQITAFLLELFVSFGAGHFYTGRNDLGGAKVAVFLILIFANIFISAFSTQHKENKFVYWIQFSLHKALLSCYIIWQIVDLCLFGANKHVDGNRMALETW
jgi:hypothetical protein